MQARGGDGARANDDSYFSGAGISPQAPVPSPNKRSTSLLREVGEIEMKRGKNSLGDERENPDSMLHAWAGGTREACCDPCGGEDERNLPEGVQDVIEGPRGERQG